MSNRNMKMVYIVSFDYHIEYSPLEVDVAGFKSKAKDYLRRAEAKKLIFDEQERKRIKEEAMGLATEKEKDQTEEQIRRLEIWLNEARQAFEMEKYATVEQRCRLILRITPEHPEANKLLEDANAAAMELVATQIRSDQVRAWQDQLLEFQDVLTLYWDPDNVVFPSHGGAKPINESVLGTFEEGGGLEGAGEAVVRRILANTHLPNLDMQQRSLSDLVLILEDKTGINMVLDNELSDTATAPMVNLKLKDMNVEQVFQILKDLYDVDYDVLPQTKESKSRPTIFVTHSCGTGGERIIHQHYVQDLINPINDYPATSVLLAGKTNQLSFEEEAGIEYTKDEEVKKDERAREMILLLESAIEPESWRQKDQYGEKPKIRITRDGYLLVKQTRRVHQQIHELLGSMRKMSGVMVAVETVLITITDDTLQNVMSEFAGLGTDPPFIDPGPTGNAWTTAQNPGDNTFPKGWMWPRYDFRDNFLDINGDGAVNVLDRFSIVNPTNLADIRNAGIFFNRNSDGDVRGNIQNTYDTSMTAGTRLTGNAGTAFDVTFLDDIQLRYIFAAVKQDSRSRTTQSPRLTLFNAQRANVSMINSRSYIQDYDVQVATNASIYDPVIGHVESGAVLDVRPTVSHDRRYIDMEMHVTFSTLAQNMRTLAALVGGENPPIIHLPELDVQSVSSTLRIPNGGTLLVGGSRDANEDDRESTVPFLSEIPILKFFFRQKGHALGQASQVILVRAKVIVLDDAAERQLRNE
ncbi:hypothetical protein ACFL54_08345 [Planctomycetota bacterium]